MADYYPLVARAVAGLDASATGEQRRALYARARAALLDQLRGVQPPLSESDVTRERLTLEEAIRRVEQEWAQRARDTSRDGNKGVRGFRDVMADADDLGGAAAQANRSTHRTYANVPSPTPEFDQLEGQATSEGRWPNSLRTRDELASHKDTDPLDELRRLIGQAKNVLVEPPPLNRTPSFPPPTAIPEQNSERAIAFVASRRGPLDVAADSPAEPFDHEQAQLYLRVRAQIQKLKEDIPSQERSQINELLDDFLTQPEQWRAVEYKKILWLCGNALRNVLAQHDSIADDPEHHYSKLPPAVAEALRRPVESWNVFVLGDPDLAGLDSIRLGPQEQAAVKQNLAIARVIIEAAKDNREIATAQAEKVLVAAIETESLTAENIHTRQAQVVADGTTKNFLSQLVRRAYLLCLDIIDPQTEEAKKLSAEYRLGIAKGAGALTATAAATGAAAALGTAALHTPAFFEFVVANAPLLKQYAVTAFQSSQLGEVIDSIRYTKARLTGSAP